MPFLAPDAVEFIGFAAPRYASETHAASGPAIDKYYLHLLPRPTKGATRAEG